MKYLKGPQNDADPNDPGGYIALREGAAVVDHAESRILRLAGRDPIGMLNAVLTNDVPAETDRGAYAALLNPKGRVQADLRVIKEPSGEAVVIVTEPEGASAVKEILGRYAPFSRVKLEDLPGWTVLGSYGPDPATIRDAYDLAEHKSAEVEINGIKLLTVGVATPVPGFEHIGPADVIRAAREHLIGAGAAPAGRDAYETARIAAGIPRFGADITPDNFPGESESFLKRAVSFGKGCYPGQETVARMHYRGSPNKKLCRFELEPGPMESPKAGDEILQGEKKLVDPISSVNVVGWLTSVAPLQIDGKVFALGYLARKADLEAPMRAEDAKVLASKPA
jgi:folate-binding protein YgfZ